MPDRWSVQLTRPLPDELVVGKGVVYRVSGILVGRATSLRSMHIGVNQSERYSVKVLPIASSERDGDNAKKNEECRYAFDATLKLLPDGSNDSWRVVATILDNNDREEAVPIAVIRATHSSPESELEKPGQDAETPLVAICMAVYRPDFETFRRQIESIRAQTHENWYLIVTDDNSENEASALIEEICDTDERILYHRNPDNLGFYRNFEKALTLVPRSARYIALSDQDDVWRPQKISRLLAKVSPGVSLVFSDMRIVAEDGRVLADSYWVNRRNEYRDLSQVLVANTVTGAASLFTSDLLDNILPFPDRIGDAFHDHWIACVAMSQGSLEYIDEALYDYYQYDDSVIGHCDFEQRSLGVKLKDAARFVFSSDFARNLKPALGRKIGAALAIYWHECRRLEVICATILLRVDCDRKVRKTLGLFGGGLSSVLRLLGLHLRFLVLRRTTDDAEFRLAMGYLAQLATKQRSDWWRGYFEPKPPS